jgi:thiol:disulfide interchange protein DsbD
VWGTNEPAGLDLARREGKPLIVDFTARWCAACHELEAITYTDAAVLEAASGFVLVQIDATDDKDPEVRRLVEKYAVNGLPAVFFLSTDGTLRPELTLRGFEDPDAFLERMKRAREASTK